ncbi:PRC-barrel domain-containing protein [Salinarimonas chemoclinalis]|uniref:PRC-barrel domain-containing protein n=1 Tax=Salinarimonas chemoclinalis TaxID=3241599 RepID=UPI00355896CA
MPAHRLLLAALLAGAAPLAAAPTLAQDAMPLEDLGGAISDAASALEDAGEDALLVRDLLGMELTDPSGETAGTVRDFVVVPGGRLVAALVETPDGARVPVPFAAIKLADRGETARATLSRPLSEVTASDGFEALEEAMPEGTDG